MINGYMGGVEGESELFFRDKRTVFNLLQKNAFVAFKNQRTNFNLLFFRWPTQIKSQKPPATIFLGEKYRLKSRSH
jgi:hypothetical protein